MAQTRIYALEPFMQAGAVIDIGAFVDVNPDDAAAILSSGRGTADSAAAAAAAKAAAVAAKAAAGN